jgi:hypothetical protein
MKRDNLLAANLARGTAVPAVLRTRMSDNI